MHGLRGFKIKVRINVWMFLIIFIVNKNIKESSRAVLFYVFKDLEKKISWILKGKFSQTYLTYGGKENHTFPQPRIKET